MEAPNTRRQPRPRGRAALTLNRAVEAGDGIVSGDLPKPPGKPVTIAENGSMAAALLVPRR
jgi:hypothetical protein